MDQVMHILAIINKDAGSVKTLDLVDFSNFLEQQFNDGPDTIEVQTVSSEGFVECLEKAADSSKVDCLVVCGGDGSASLAASLAHQHNKIFGLLPAGTMNLFARTLGMPMDLYEAAKALSNSRIVKFDLASVNGRPYIHQFSIGLQPALIEKREEGSYNSKITKALSGIGATLSTLSDQEEYQLEIEIDGKVTSQTVSLLTVSNNPYGEDHLPYADKLNDHKLGLYWANSIGAIDKTALVVDILSGNWNVNPDLKHKHCQAVQITIKGWIEGTFASLDGELIELEENLILKSMPAALQVLIPNPPFSMNSYMEDA
jgi:diacylglycerol kinase family enzyme